MKIDVMSRRGTMLLLVLMPVLVSLACVTLTGGGSPAEVVFGSGPFTFPDATTGLLDLSSYKATLVLSFEGTRDGQTQQWSRTYVMLTTKEPAARLLTIDKTGDASNPDPVFIAEMDGAAYERRGENNCIANAIDQGNLPAEQLEPASFLTGVIGAEEAGSDTINEIAVDHYTFDERALGQSGVTQSTGEMWVASEGGYLVKYLLTTKGDADHFGEGIEGALTSTYELTDVNQPITFKLPDDCPAGLVDAPLLPDASEVLNVPGMLKYDTATSLADASAFYQEQLSDLGWRLIGEPAITETTVWMDLAQGNQIMSVMISTDGAGTKVNIVLGKAQE